MAQICGKERVMVDDRWTWNFDVYDESDAPTKEGYYRTIDDEGNEITDYYFNEPRMTPPMTVKELITMLLDEPMDAEIYIGNREKHIDKYGNEHSGYMFEIDDIERFNKNCRILNYTDWRKVCGVDMRKGADDFVKTHEVVANGNCAICGKPLSGDRVFVCEECNNKGADDE